MVHHHNHHLNFKIRFVFPVPALLGTIFSIATLTVLTDWLTDSHRLTDGVHLSAVKHQLRSVRAERLSLRPLLLSAVWGEEGRRQLVNIFHFIIDNWGELRAPTTPARGEITSLSATKMSKMSQCVSVLWKQPGVYIMSEHNRWSSLSPHNT